MMRLDGGEAARQLEEQKQKKPVGLKRLSQEDPRKKPPTPEPDEIYEEDFDNFSEEEKPPPPKPSKPSTPVVTRKQPDSAAGFSVDEIKRAVAAENAAAIKKEFAEETKTLTQTYKPPRVKATFNVDPKAIERQEKRNRDLVDVVAREVESFSLFDMFPMSAYEKHVGCLNAKTIKNSAVQSNEDNIEREVQTTDLELTDKSAQWPDDMGVVKQANTAPASLNK
jgi:hypothetical protein